MVKAELMNLNMQFDFCLRSVCFIIVFIIVCDISFFLFFIFSVTVNNSLQHFFENK